MIYLTSFVVLLLIALSYAIYKYGKLSSSHTTLRKEVEKVAEVTVKLAKEIKLKEEEIEQRDQEIMELAIENDDLDAAAELLNSLFQNQGANGKLPN